MTIAIAVIAALLLFSLWLLLLATSRDNRVLSREPSEFELAARRFSDSLVQVQIAFADALTPTLMRVIESMNQWNQAWAGQIKEFEAKHGPRPEGVPFLEWAESVESNQEGSHD